MTRFCVVLFSVVSGFLTGDSFVQASFQRDVVSKVVKKERRLTHQQNLEDELLAHAIPLEKYNSQLKALGVDFESSAFPATHASTRRLDDADDFYVNEQYMYSFSGYSLKYAKCQPIQQFSEDALAAGQYSPMVTQDIVILRLCPYKSCSTSRQYGCHYNYAEYAISLNNYIRVMLRYRADRKVRLCEWCAACIAKNSRKLDEADDAGGDDYYAAAADDDGGNKNNKNNDDGGDDNLYYGPGGYTYDADDECYIYGTYCSTYDYDCDEEYQNQQQEYQDDYYKNLQDKTVEEEEFYDYLGCTEVKDNYGGIYFVRPTCDTSSTSLGKIAMIPYYDAFCSQSAANHVNMDNFEVAFNDTIFSEFYEGSCIDCTESNYPPAFTSSSYMCNKIHSVGADCTTQMVYDLFDGQQSSSTECAFIESIRYGTYDASGEIATEASEGAEEVVTVLQKLALVASAFICAIFVMYACYLHHAMTNLLIKSLSHRELLPPSRHSRRRTPSKSKRRRSKSRGSRRGDDDDDDDDDDEWDRSRPV